MSPQFHIEVVTTTPVTLYRVYRTTNGIDRHPVGPSWLTPATASAYCGLQQELANQHISPLRADGESPRLPSPGVGDSSAEPIG